MGFHEGDKRCWCHVDLVIEGLNMCYWYFWRGQVARHPAFKDERAALRLEGSDVAAVNFIFILTQALDEVCPIHYSHNPISIYYPEVFVGSTGMIKAPRSN